MSIAIKRMIERKLATPITRGLYKGEAWADKTSSRHYRVGKDHAGVLYVHMHSTQIIRCMPDGTTILDSGGWINHRTTRDKYADWGVRVHTHVGNGYRQTAIAGTAFYDGMRLSPQGEVVDPKPLCKYVADHAARKEWRAQANVSQFKEALPMLVAAVQDNPQMYLDAGYMHLCSIRMSAQALPEDWPKIALAGMREAGGIHATPSQVWQKYRAHCVSEMRNAVPV